MLIDRFFGSGSVFHFIHLHDRVPIPSSLPNQRNHARTNVTTLHRRNCEHAAALSAVYGPRTIGILIAQHSGSGARHACLAREESV
jgi:hypothetical protein